ncbi:MAG: hypothetical protein JWQ45_2977 [Blastococcus sp.]|jgi:cytochrome P450|nr:hypothetical protein [Blastococcus sp.]
MTTDVDLETALLSEDFVRDPYPVLDQLRNDQPVYWSEGIGAWLLTRYDDIVWTFKTVPGFSNEGRLGRAADHVTGPEAAQLDAFRRHYATKGLLHSDPPDHTRLRRAVLPFFSPRTIEGLRPRVSAIVDNLIDDALSKGGMNAIDDLAFALPVSVLANMLGVPASEGALFRRWADDLLAFQGVNKPAAQLLLTAQESLVAARSYIAALISGKRRDTSQDDIVSVLLRAGSNVSDEEIINTCVTLLVAGHETTTSLIGNGLYLMLSRPEVFAALRADEALVTGTVEEILRFESPVARQTRVLTEDTSLRDTTMHAGDVVIQMLHSANRDPAQFPNPALFDITRRPNRHIAFGQGIHFCVGAPLSRLEGDIVFRSLLRRAPRMRLLDTSPDWDVTKPNSRVLNSLSVAFG